MSYEIVNFSFLTADVERGTENVQNFDQTQAWH